MFKKSFNILKNNIAFIHPILLLQIIFLTAVIFSTNRMQMLIPRILMWVSIFCLIIACFAGWFYINKYAILTYDEKDTPEEINEKTIQNLKKFFEGIGSDFIRTLFAFIVIVLVYLALFYGMYKFCINNIGIPEFVNDIPKLIQNSEKEQIMEFLNNISESDKLMFTKWVITFNLGLSIINFFAILYFAVMSFERKNFIVSFFKALKFFAANLLETISIMLFVFLIYVCINALSAISSSNLFLSAFMIIFITLYFHYYVILIFSFYYDKSISCISTK